MDPSYLGPTLTFLSIAVMVVLFLLSALMRQSSHQSESTQQAIQGAVDSIAATNVTLTRGDAAVSGLTARVDDLHQWRTQQQERELESLREQVADYRRRESA